ncbi:hypothetical protein NR798_13660 [Archangium gephyra]|uniref:hypothetical protein n=1 Tax=Archangium gephyra TaxID=48 RepID=UPI0035D47298
MRLRSLVVALLLSGCQQPAQPEPADGLERPPSAMKDPGAQPAPPEAAREAQPAEAPSPEAPSAQALPPPGDELPEQTWSARSADGNAEIQQTAFRDGKTTRCTSTSTWSSPWDDKKVMWRWDTCIATREQLKFVSPDGKRVLVIDPLPASLQTKANWQDLEVATLYEHGVRVKGAKAGALLRAPIEVREPQLRIVWVKGHGGFPGTSPRYTSNGKAVELETVDGHSFSLGFEGEGFPAAPEEKHVFAGAAGMYQYEDDKKTVNFVSSFDDVPEQYRSRARPVEAQVLTVSGPMGLGEPRPSEPTPEPQPALEASKDAAAKEALEKAKLASPAELLDKARTAAKQVEEVQRTREQMMNSLLSESSSQTGQEPASSGPASSPAAGNRSPEAPLEKARIPTPEELLDKARATVKKVEQFQRQQDKVTDGK